MRERHNAKDREGALAAVSDEMIDGIDFLGSAGEVGDRVKAYVDGGVEKPIVFPLPWGADRMAVVEKTLTAALGRVIVGSMPGKVPQKPNEKKKGKSLKEKREAKKAKKG